MFPMMLITLFSAFHRSDEIEELVERQGRAETEAETAMQAAPAGIRDMNCDQHPNQVINSACNWCYQMFCPHCVTHEACLEGEVAIK